MMSALVLHPPTLEHRGHTAAIRCAYDGNRELAVTIDAPASVLHRLSPSIAPFVPMAMVIAGTEHRDLFVCGTLEDLYWTNLSTAFWPLMRGLFGFPNVKIQQEGGANRKGFFRQLAGAINRPPDGIALMFSAGVDSFYSLRQLRRTGSSPAWLLNINAGAHDYDRACWKNRVANVRRVGDLIGASTITIDTDFHENFRLEHIRGAMIRNLCASFTLAPPITRFAYSSGYTFEDISWSNAASEPDFIQHAVCQPMTPPGLTLALLGHDASRIEKTRAIADDPLCQNHLDVCTNQSYQGAATTDQPRNCGRCAKCIRTMFTLDHYGQLDLFASQFDVNAFRARRSEWIAILSASTTVHDHHVLRLLSARPDWSK